MKLESLIIVFLLIIIPITMVLSEYVDKRIEAEKTELNFNTKLLNSTHDAIKEYQLRTVNNEFSYDTNNKIVDIESSINTFFTSLSSNFGYSGYNTEAMKEYVPAVVFTLYDGYYIYSPYRNTLTDIKNKDIDGVTDPDYIGYDSSYSKEGENYYGLKPYVYYSCRYTYDPIDLNDFVITYTLDNYITIQGKINGTYVYDYGYLYGISDTRNDNNGTIFKEKVSGGEDIYWYNGVKFEKGDKEELQEYVEDNLYSYVKINGKKYYLKKGKNENAEIFYIEKNGEKNYSQFSTPEDKQKAYNAIKGNISAYEYYKNAYEFSERVLTNKTQSQLSNPRDKMDTELKNGGYNLKDKLNSKHAVYFKEIVEQKANNTFNANGIVDLTEYGEFKIFDYNDTTISPPQLEDSNFNKHRKSIIRYVVETNLLPAITSYASNSKSVDEFLMPKISDTDWDLIEKNVCAISFMQGMNIGFKKYNGYSVVANSLTKEYVDEDDIYIVKDKTYYRVNDSSLNEVDKKVKWNNTAKAYQNNNSGFYAGILKIDFEERRILDSDSKQTKYYFMQHPLGSYTSIFGSTGINTINKDMYQYFEEHPNDTIKEIYYKALGRERWGAFNINNVNFERDGSNNVKYFLDSYEFEK